MCTYWKSKIELDTYVSIRTPEGNSYGGRQKWLDDVGKSRRGSVLSAYGCGLVALGDFFLTAGERWHKVQPSLENRCHRPYGGGPKTIAVPLQKPQYVAYLLALRRYLTILPGIGANAWQIWAGAWRYLRQSGQKASVHWGVLSWQMEKEIVRMLEQGLPVIFCVGPNLNPLQRQLQVPMYQLEEQGTRLKERARVRAHYMSITGLCRDGQGERYLQVASWGKQYYIRWQDYELYRKKQPPLLGGWLSNMLYVKLR